jgi:hypothetical protein
LSGFAVLKKSETLWKRTPIPKNDKQIAHSFLRQRRFDDVKTIKRNVTQQHYSLSKLAYTSALSSGKTAGKNLSSNTDITLKRISPPL